MDFETKWEWKDAEGIEYWVVKALWPSGITDLIQPWHNGYCRFPKRPVTESGYKGILTYVPVHGGISFAEETENGMEYGFDCNHAFDKDNYLLQEEMWLRAECEWMAKAILLAVEYENDYLTAATDEEKAEIIDAYHAQCRIEHGVDFRITDNFGAMVAVLGGQL